MSKTTYNKLVRDKIPVIIRDNGGVAATRVLDDEEYRHALLEKLIEEAKELLEDPSYGERADVEEVLRAIDQTFDFSPDEIERLRVDKADKRGGFSQRIFLEKVSE